MVELLFGFFTFLVILAWFAGMGIVAVLIFLILTKSKKTSKKVKKFFNLQ